MVKSPSASDLTAQTADRLRREIYRGLIPSGARLAEAAVAGRMGVSRVPVREALRRLEQDGLIVFTATGRAVVRQLSQPDFEELFLLRLSLEPLAARLATPYLRHALAGLEQSVANTRQAKSLMRVAECDLDFHQQILTASGHHRMQRVWRSLRCELELWLNRLHRRRPSDLAAVRRATIAAHRALIEGFRQRSPQACEGLMRRHLLSWRERLPMIRE
jgi:DNA-binding GntR family transcriptional regulator